MADTQGLRLRRGPAAAVLMYHRIERRAVDPLALFVTPDNFAAQIAALRQFADIVPAGDILLAGDRPRIAITFDDGYEDNATYAAPVLESHDAPACIFATNQFVPDAPEFWWDQLDHLLLREPSDVAFVEAHLPNRCVRFDVRTVAGRTRTFSYLNRVFRTLARVERESCLAHLHGQLGRSPVRCSDHARLNADELRRLDASGLIEIGGHTATHQSLRAADDIEAVAEIESNRSALASVTGRVPRVFAYPYGDGGPRDWVNTRSAGYDLGFSTVTRAVGRVHRPHWLPRLFIGNWAAEEFTGRVTAALRAS